MSPAASFLLFFSLALLSLARAQGRAPHGLAYENPMAFSPSAFDFFHPNGQKPSTQNPCAASNCSPLPMAAQVEASLAHQSKASSNRVGAGGIAGIVFGFVFAVLLAMGVYYVAVTRRANLTRANSVQPDAWFTYYKPLTASTQDHTTVIWSSCSLLFFVFFPIWGKKCCIYHLVTN